MIFVIRQINFKGYATSSYEKDGILTTSPFGLVNFLPKKLDNVPYLVFETTDEQMIQFIKGHPHYGNIINEYKPIQHGKNK